MYEPHLATTLPFGLTPLADQQLAGLLMWGACQPALYRRRTRGAFALSVGVSRLPRRGAMIVWLKFAHLAAISLWCAGLICLPGL